MSSTWRMSQETVSQSVTEDHWWCHLQVFCQLCLAKQFVCENCQVWLDWRDTDCNPEAYLSARCIKEGNTDGMSVIVWVVVGTRSLLRKQRRLLYITCQGTVLTSPIHMKLRKNPDVSPSVLLKYINLSYKIGYVWTWLKWHNSLLNTIPCFHC
jgi:hypothetical protein